MLTAEARIQTEQPSPYLIQLCQHANSINHKTLHPTPARHIAPRCSTWNGPTRTGLSS